MASFYIHIDSSTLLKNGRTYGPSTVAWTIVSDGIYPYRAGVAYSHLNGPNKIIYEGILSAISTIESRNLSIGENKVVVYTDSKIIVDQLNIKIVAKKLSKDLLLIKNKMKEYANTKFEFIYENEKNKDFKVVDTLSKNAKGWFPSMIKNLKK